MKEPLLIEKEVVQALLAYLAKRPYEEVAQGIAALVNLQPANPPSLEKDVKKQ